VTDVETTPDLRHARVWVSVIGGAPERAETLAALERAMGYVRHELGVRLRIKRIPALHVALDDSASGDACPQNHRGAGPGHDSAGEALADAPRSETLPTPVPRLRREGDAELDADGQTGAGEEPPAAGDAAPGRAEATPRRARVVPAAGSRSRVGGGRQRPGRR